MEKTLNIDALGRRVRQHRMEKGYSVEKLSEISGVSESHISNIESANVRGSAEAIVRIANALDTSVDVLLSDSLKGKTLQGARMHEYAELLEDCSEAERKIIIEMGKTLKKNLREMG